MPIHIYYEAGLENIEYLCEGIWDLPVQIESLENWLTAKGKSLPGGRKVADIDFDVRKNATGGGAVLHAASMRIMGEINMDVYFSEYSDSITD